MDVEKLNDTVTSICLKASILSIPRGCTPNYRPFWNDQLEEATTVRNKARQKYEQKPTAENRQTYNKAVADAKQITKDSKRNNWKTTCENNLQQ